MGEAKRRKGALPSQAELARLADEMERNGCPRCGTRLGVGVPYLIAKTSQVDWGSRCVRPECAADFVAGPLLLSFMIGGDDPWVESDKGWFQANPRRCWRLRWPMPGELEAQATDETLAEKAGLSNVPRTARAALIEQEKRGARIAIAVYQYEPGRRARQALVVRDDEEAPLDSYTDAGIVALGPTSLVDDVEQYRPGLAATNDRALAEARQDKWKRRIEVAATVIKDMKTK